MTLLGKARNALVALGLTGALIGGGAAIANAATEDSAATTQEPAATWTPAQASPNATPAQDDRGDCPEEGGGAGSGYGTANQ
jgi:hypothetical protein